MRIEHLRKSSLIFIEFCLLRETGEFILMTDVVQDYLLELKNISKTFGEHKVLSDINLSISKGEVLCIIGPTGSGKSTLLR